MNKEIPFKPVTFDAKKVLDETFKKRILPKTSDIKLICPFLGPGDKNVQHKEDYKLRISCREFINNEHISFFLEDLEDNEVIKYLKERGVEEIKIKAFTKDRDSLNEMIIADSDIVFIICKGDGPLIELGKYGKKYIHKIKILLPACNYYPEDLQLGALLKSLEAFNPNCIITYNDEEDAHKMIQGCLVVALRNKIMRELKDEV